VLYGGVPPAAVAESALDLLSAGTLAEAIEQAVELLELGDAAAADPGAVVRAIEAFVAGRSALGRGASPAAEARVHQLAAQLGGLWGRQLEATAGFAWVALPRFPVRLPDLLRPRRDRWRLPETEVALVSADRARVAFPIYYMASLLIDRARRIDVVAAYDELRRGEPKAAPRSYTVVVPRKRP